MINFCTIVDGQNESLVTVNNEHSSVDESPLGAQLGEYIGCHVVVPEDVMELQAVEVGLEPAYLLAVGIHLLLGALPVLVDLLDDDFGVAVGKEPLDANRCRDPETVDESLVFGRVVGCLEE